MRSGEEVAIGLTRRDQLRVEGRSVDLVDEVLWLLNWGHVDIGVLPQVVPQRCGSTTDTSDDQEIGVHQSLVRR
jgi:hypothetical protein